MSMSRVLTSSPDRHVGLGLILLFLVACSGTRLEFSSGIAFEDVSVVDVREGITSDGMTVVVQGNRIVAVEPTSGVRLAEGVQRVSASGMYIIPGLWDMHVHAMDEDTHELFAKLFVANGITGIREMWGSLDVAALWRTVVETGDVVLPRFLIAGNLIDGADPIWPGSNVATTPAEGRAMVDSLVQAGAGFIKVYSKLETGSFPKEKAVVKDVGKAG